MFTGPWQEESDRRRAERQRRQEEAARQAEEARAAFLARIVRDILPPVGTNDGEERPPPGACPRPVEGPS